MSMILFVGIVLTVVPATLILGFALVIFFSFARDDSVAQAAVNLALIILFIGLMLIGGHFLGGYMG
ncbi:hypothetical protein HN358_04600 [Candidatus Uhrbacteria bacterium]|jgi:hypothetical protein|nr:hypothetical protein [Candidatus Uhrbacteria bacterium]MBT7717062.1 hypothetical protein [Candidatus Uhrbacteria bacterium]